eukprot:m.83895 g.83895  ORF g.83895 m.83895 type:complete len:410 (-) comp11250_c0_seq2:1130-2359(-)
MQGTRYKDPHRQEDVLGVPERAALRKRLFFEHIDRGGRDGFRGQCFCECDLVHRQPPTNGNKYPLGLHCSEFLGAAVVQGGTGPWECAHDKVRFSEEFELVGRAVDFVGVWGWPVGVVSDCEHAHAKALLGRSSTALPNVTIPHDSKRLSRHRVHYKFLPSFLLAVLDHTRDLLVEVEDRCHDPLCERSRERPLSVGDRDALSLERLFEELLKRVDPREEGVDPPDAGQFGKEGGQDTLVAASSHKDQRLGVRERRLGCKRLERIVHQERHPVNRRQRLHNRALSRGHNSDNRLFSRLFVHYPRPVRISARSSRELRSDCWSVIELHHLVPKLQPRTRLCVPAGRTYVRVGAVTIVGRHVVETALRDVSSSHSLWLCVVSTTPPDFPNIRRDNGEQGCCTRTRASKNGC